MLPGNDFGQVNVDRNYFYRQQQHHHSMNLSQRWWTLVPIFFGILFIFVNCLANNNEIHHHLTPDERTLLLGHASEIPAYHVFETSPELFKTLADEQIFSRVKRRRAKRSSDGGGNGKHSGTLKVEFNAFDHHFHLKLWPNHHLLSPKFRLAKELVEKMSEALGPNRSTSAGAGGGDNRSANDDEKANTTTTLLMMMADEIEHCFYQGVVEGEADSAVALSLCNGMQGVIETRSSVYIINPIPGHTAERIFLTPSASNRPEKKPRHRTLMYHIILKRNELHDYQCPHGAARRRAGQTPATGNSMFGNAALNRTLSTVQGKHRTRRSTVNEEGESNHLDSSPSSSNDTTINKVEIPSTSTGPTRTLTIGNDLNITVETAVFVDESLYNLLSKTFPADTEQQIVLYILTIMNAVQMLFKQPSIGRPVEVSVVLMDLLKQQPKNLHPSDNIDTYLTNFCVWQHKKRLRESGGPTPDWDHALLLSGINMYVVDGRGRRKRHVVGLAPVSGMCNSLNSCTISEGTSFQTVLVAGHEMGHSLGMEHDGPQDGNGCNKDDFVMSPTLGPGKTTWSECSRQYLDKFVLTPQATCVLGRSSHANIIHQYLPHHQLPGERFSVEDQCRFRFGPTARHHHTQPLTEICRVIKCHVKTQVKTSVYSGRALYQYPSKTTYNTHPALEGTECGFHKWCREGRCVPKINLDTFDQIINTTLLSNNNNNNENELDNNLVSSSKLSTSPGSKKKVAGTGNKKEDLKHANNNNNNKTSTKDEEETFVEDDDEAYLFGVNKYNPYRDPNRTRTRNSSRWTATRINAPGAQAARKPIAGNWSEWREYGPCISECVTPSDRYITPVGIMSAVRRCNNPAPSNGGASCSGPDTRVKLCNAANVCTVDSATSAASGPGSRSLDKTTLEPSTLGVRYRIRSVSEFIEDTCLGAAKANDKIEGHGTQYPSYDSASHSCFVWCSKKGGGYLSQGWRLPDGAPCGQRLMDETKQDRITTTGYCYNGQCKPYNCAGEVFLRSVPSTSTFANVYNWAEGTPTTSPPTTTTGAAASTATADETLNNNNNNNTSCALQDIFSKILAADEQNGLGEEEDNYRLVRIAPKEKRNHTTHAEYYPLDHNTMVDRPADSMSQSPPSPTLLYNIADASMQPPPASNWSSWTPVTECQYSAACITTGRGFRLVTRECRRAASCVGRREALQVCDQIEQATDPTLYDLYEQYCPADRRLTADVYAIQICQRYRLKYPSLLSGGGRQLLGKNSGCIVTCEDRVWKDIHYQMDAFEDGKFPFGTDCSVNGETGYCLNGKCIHFDSQMVSFDTSESVLYRSELLQLFLPDTLLNKEAVDEASNTKMLYSTINNELYKRATSHISGLTASASSSFTPTATTSFPSAYESFKQRRRFKRSTGGGLGRKPMRLPSGILGGHRTTSSSFQLRPKYEGNGDIYRKSLLSITDDPEADDISWSLLMTEVKNGKGNGAPMKQAASGLTSWTQWKPLKKPARPIKFTEHGEEKTQQQSTNKNKPPEHLATFTLVKHSKTKPSATSTIGLRVATTKNTARANNNNINNQTKFLDDDEEDIDNKTTNNKIKTGNTVEVKPKPAKMADKNRFGLGHEAWPEAGGAELPTSPQELSVLSPQKEQSEMELRVEPYVWSVILSECSRPCGQGIRTVRIVCTVGQKTVDDRYCETENRPQHTNIEPCKERDCNGKWRAEPWSECSARCTRNSFQSRTIVCVGPVGGKEATVIKFPGLRRRRQANYEDALTAASSEVEPEESEVEASEEDEEESGEDGSDEREHNATPSLPRRVEQPGSTTTARLYSILSHEHCDLDTKPVQWRSCHTAECNV